MLFLPIEKVATTENESQVVWNWNSPLIRSLSFTLPLYFCISSSQVVKSLTPDGKHCCQSKESPTAPKWVCLMKWTTSPLQTHTHSTCDIPDSSALADSQANGTCQWSRPFFLSRPREKRAIKSNGSLQRCWDLGLRRPCLSGCLIIMWPSCWFW